ncbi:DUF3300 domain-containing protein [Lysobacter claricitrinus]|uniref:DUF3300 domain-containing protein n=1 Tax=Lysobacter claricitrinus TaxID=3367728 RepID=UPI0037DAAE75
MRIPLVCVVSAALLLTSSCSRDKAPAAAPATTAAATTPAIAPAAPAPAARPKEVVFTAPELMQMVAPIALYPDALVAQVLMAATYPGDVADAAAWSKAHPDAKGDDAVKQVASQPWDPSVQSLVAFPQVLAAMGGQGAWVQRMGDAFLAQPDDVMDAIQQLRHKAKAKGNLESNQYQKISSQPAAAASAQSAPVAPAQPSDQGAVGGYESAPAGDTIIIESSDPQTVYVPSYDPNTAYGNWDYPDYPPTYYPPPPNYYPMGGALATGLMFGVGLAITDSLWGDVDWNDNDINIDVDRYNSINSNRQINANQANWNHNAANRDGVPYRDQYNRQNNSQRLEGADRRSEYRGEDAQRTQSREQARASMEKRGVDAPARSNQEARDRAQAATRDRAQAGSRDQARERAQAQTRDRAQVDRAQSASRDQARDRAQSSQRQQQASRANAQNRSQASARHKQSQSNTQARSAARSQQQTRQSPRNNAFAGASRPQESRASAQRGQASNASAQRSRSSGQQAQRQSSQRQSSQRQAPQRQSSPQRQSGNRR